jgi:serine-type D-Ala-D-Ala carboxypeptidase (penicillin-binding protein 5/6)
MRKDHCLLLSTRPLRVFGVAFLALLLVGLPNRTAFSIETASQTAILMDMTTGAVLMEKNADQPVPTASMSKIMTTYMLFEALKEGRVKLGDLLPVSENAWRKGGAPSGGSAMFLEIHSQATVEELLRGIVVQSGNDASIVIAEGLAGTEEAFAEQMTRRAHELGMTRSRFRNSTGWPHPDHVSTPRDLALLAKLTIEQFPEYYHYYSETEYTYNGIRQGNRNPLLYTDMGVDGLKTGHTEEAGYGLTASAKIGDRRLILVITGLPDAKERAEEAKKLMSWGFREFDNYKLLAVNEPAATAPVWLGEADSVSLITGDDVVVTLPRAARPDMIVKVRYEGPIPAPVEKGQRLGTLVVEAPGASTAEFPLFAGERVEQLGLFGRIGAALRQIVMSQIN